MHASYEWYLSDDGALRRGFLGGILQLHSDITMCSAISADYDSILAATRVTS